MNLLLRTGGLEGGHFGPAIGSTAGRTTAAAAGKDILLAAGNGGNSVAAFEAVAEIIICSGSSVCNCCIRRPRLVLSRVFFILPVQTDLRELIKCVTVLPCLYCPFRPYMAGLLWNGLQGRATRHNLVVEMRGVWSDNINCDVIRLAGGGLVRNFPARCIVVSRRRDVGGSLLQANR